MQSAVAQAYLDRACDWYADQAATSTTEWESLRALAMKRFSHVISRLDLQLGLLQEVCVARALARSPLVGRDDTNASVEVDDLRYLEGRIKVALAAPFDIYEKGDVSPDERSRRVIEELQREIRA